MTIFWRRVLSLWLSPSAVLCGIVGWSAWQTYPHIIVATDNWAAARPANTFDRINTTLDKINAGCVDIQGDYVCGPIEQLSQTEKNVGILAARSAQQVQQTGTLVTAVANNLNTVGEAVKDSAGHINGTADAATGTLKAATDTLGEGKRTIAAAQPLLAAYTQSGNDMDALLKRKAIGDLLDNLAGVTAHGNAIAGDFQQVADKARADYLRPVPWYMQPLKKSSDVLDIAGLLSRHIP